MLVQPGGQRGAGRTLVHGARGDAVQRLEWAQGASEGSSLLGDAGADGERVSSLLLAGGGAHLGEDLGLALGGDALLLGALQKRARQRRGQ